MGRKKKVMEGEVIKLIENIVLLTSGEDLDTEGMAEDDIKKLAGILGITPMQALLLSVFVDQSDDHCIRARDIAGHFNCRTVSVLAQNKEIEGLVEKRFIRRTHNNNGDVNYSVPQTTLDALMKNQCPEPEVLSGLTAREWLLKTKRVLTLLCRNEINNEEANQSLTELIDKNQHLLMVQHIKSLDLEHNDLMLYMVMSMRCIYHNDDCIMVSDFEDYFDDFVTSMHMNQLCDGSHKLLKLDLVEHNNNNGQADSHSWRLSKHSKRDIYAELHLRVADEQEADTTDLMRHADIREKKMYYNTNVTNQVKRLTSLLEKERMARVLKRLGDKGLRKGFTCLFYGGPGTGKTETVLQLARQTGRNVMVVDVPSIRSKWVGETERNIKDLFDRYRNAAACSEMTPILLFNEADALLNKRNEGCVNSTDKMENAMQNIILQEMENLEGIMIATTNLTGSLDSAFERRFLYKIEFEKPTPRERCHIWQSLLTDLTDEQALMLAERFDFSGGQIENIARKRIIADILDDTDELNMDGIIESCKNELLDKKRQTRIGFGLCG